MKSTVHNGWAQGTVKTIQSFNVRIMFHMY